MKTTRLGILISEKVRKRPFQFSRVWRVIKVAQTLAIQVICLFININSYRSGVFPGGGGGKWALPPPPPPKLPPNLPPTQTQSHSVVRLFGGSRPPPFENPGRVRPCMCGGGGGGWVSSAFSLGLNESVRVIRRCKHGIAGCYRRAFRFRKATWNTLLKDGINVRSWIQERIQKGGGSRGGGGHTHWWGGGSDFGSIC